MFAIAILIGIYSYLILGLGILGLLYKSVIIFVTVLFITASYLYFKRKPPDFPGINLKNEKVRPFLVIFLLLAGVNLIGALGPELSFDSLWYHLTLPKIFLENHSIDFIPGGLFYYSLMPKLGEMLYVLPVSFSFETGAKLIQWAFGISTSFIIFKISRKYFDEKISFFAVLIFYANLVVAWESTVAYIDLIRAFFEIMALWACLVYFETKDRKWILESAVMLGLAISTKLIAVTSIPIFVVLFLVFEKNKVLAFKNSIIFTVISIFVILPWLFFAVLNTGNPIYPLLTETYMEVVNPNLLSLFGVKDIFVLFLRSADPISPIYLILLPLAFIYFRNLRRELKIIAIYSFIALIIWYLIPRTGGGRFILPYLPALSALSVIVVYNIKQTFLKKYMTFLIIAVCLTTIVYRGIANAKYVPVILGFQSKNEFLTKNLNFNFGDFYDIDGWFGRNIREGDKILLYGFHNLYYADFPFVHESYVKKGDRFNYIATQNSELPERFSHWNLIYENTTTHVKLYSIGEMMWTY